MFWPTINSYKRLVDGFWAPVKPTWGIDNRTASFRVIAGSAEVDAARDALPGRRRQSVPRDGRGDRRRPARRREGPEADAPPITGTNQGAENIPRAPRTLIETTRDLPAVRRSRATGSATTSSTTSPRPANGNGASGWTRVTDWELKRYFEII